MVGIEADDPEGAAVSPAIRLPEPTAGPDGGSRPRRRRLRALVPLALAALASACSTAPSPKAAGRITLVDGSGAPIQGALVLPEVEFPNSPQRRDTQEEFEARVSDAYGVIRAPLDDYFWESDACYHFRIHKDGFDDVTMAVSRDLYPSVLRIDLRPQAPDAPPGPARPAAAPVATPPRQP
jgi:hypothetical protein